MKIKIQLVSGLSARDIEIEQDTTIGEVLQANLHLYGDEQLRMRTGNREANYVFTRSGKDSAFGFDYKIWSDGTRITITPGLVIPSPAPAKQARFWNAYRSRPTWIAEGETVWSPREAPVTG